MWGIDLMLSLEEMKIAILRRESDGTIVYSHQALVLLYIRIKKMSHKDAIDTVEFETSFYKIVMDDIEKINW